MPIIGPYQYHVEGQNRDTLVWHYDRKFDTYEKAQAYIDTLPKVRQYRITLHGYFVKSEDYR
jgi:hypothetical protein